MEPALGCVYSCVGPKWPEFWSVGCQCQMNAKKLHIHNKMLHEGRKSWRSSEWNSCRGHLSLQRDSLSWALIQHMRGYLWLGICFWALLTEPKLQPDEPLGKILKCRSREKVTLAMFELASACIACSVLKRIMIFWAVRTTFCTILYFLVITTKYLIVKKHMWDGEQPALFHYPVYELICAEIIFIFSHRFISYISLLSCFCDSGSAGSVTHSTENSEVVPQVQIP